MLGWNSFDWEKSCALIILDSVGYHEFAEAETPNIDSFGRKRFEAFAQGTFTGPSIQAMMLGYLPWAGTETQIFGRELWLPNSFKERGYKTVALASLPYCQSYYFGRGFDIFRDMRRISMTTKMVKDTLKIVEPLEKFFLFMDIGATHRPYDYGETRTDWKERELQKYNYEGGELDEEYLDYLRERQVEAIEFVDEEIGPLLEELEDTVTIITSDHGACFGEGGVCGHGIGGEDAVLKQLKVPLIFHW